MIAQAPVTIDQLIARFEVTDPHPIKLPRSGSILRDCQDWRDRFLQFLVTGGYLPDCKGK